MKKRFFFSIFAATAMLLATSCQKDEEGSQAKVSFNLNQPGMETKAYSDGLTATTLSYLVFEQGNTTPVFVGDDISFSSSATVNFTLLRGRTYDIVFWADAPNSPYTFDLTTGTVTVDYSTDAVTRSQNESRDAFFATRTIFVDGTINETIEMKRPFAQLNIGSTDTAAAAAANFTPTETSVTVSKVYSTFNLLDSSVSNPVTDLIYSMAAIPTGETFPVAGVAYLSMNYLLVDEQELVDIDFVVSDGSSTITREFTNIPVQPNYRTNIYGNLLTSTAGITVEIEPNYDGNYTYNEIAAIARMGGSYTLNEDLTMPAEIPFLAAYEDFNLTLNANLTSGNAANYGIIVKGGTTTINGSGNIASQGGGIGVDTNASLVFNSGNLSINTTSTSGRYLFYAAGAGSTITINGGNFDFNSAQNQKRAYIYAGAGATVYVTGGTFGKPSTRNDYKNGIYGSGTVIITGGSFGFNPTQWVPAGYTATENAGVWTVAAN